MIFCIGVTLLFDFKLLNTTASHLLELEYTVKALQLGKNDFFNKRTLIVMLLKEDYRTNNLMFHVLVVAERTNSFYLRGHSTIYFILYA